MAISKEFINLMQNEEKAEQLHAMNDEAEIKSFFEANGVDVDSEAKNIATSANELTESEMDEVTGGFLGGIPSLIGLIGTAGKIYACNKQTNWGRNGKPCSCGFHSLFY